MFDISSQQVQACEPSLDSRNVPHQRRSYTLYVFYVLGVTSEIQLIDDGIGYAVKNEMGHSLDRWLEEDDNLTLWTSENFPMWRKRALITNLAASAWEHVCSHFDFEKAATRIGMRMTIDGTGDDLIKIQGVENYSFSALDAGKAPLDISLVFHVANSR